MVAEQLSKIKVPQVTIAGGGEGSKGDTMGQLINLMLLKSTGVLDSGQQSINKAITAPPSKIQGPEKNIGK